ncbi:MAG: hypothetical protein NZ572_06225 [Thermoflexus sp.]|nr:hypothetical protein [Thermoflexus sp.]
MDVTTAWPETIDWEHLEVTEADLEALLNRFLEDPLPRTAEELSRFLIQHRLQELEEQRRASLAGARLFRPKDRYQVGERLFFPHLNFAIGTVVGIRDGHNPEIGPFKVLQVRFEDDGVLREFAAEYPLPHSLNELDGMRGPDEQSMYLDEVWATWGRRIEERLLAQLRSSPDFVNVGDHWFPKALLVELHEGHLNLVEAVLDVHGGGPLSPEALLSHLELPADIPSSLQIFSLNAALYRDPRFDEVGPAGQFLWFLRRVEPPEVLETPPRLQGQPYTGTGERLDEALRRIAMEIDDELSVPEEIGPWIGEADEVVWMATYPHLAGGTAPLTRRTAQVFPLGRTYRIRFEFEDPTNGRRWPGWVVRERKYIFGLKEWYQARQVQPGCLVVFQRTREPGVIRVQLKGRSRRDWVRVVRVEEGRLTFDMLRRQIPSEFDDQSLIYVDDPAALEELWPRWRNRTVSSLAQHLVPALAALTPQGTIHARTVYQAVNLLIRMPPESLFEEILGMPRCAYLGDGYWRWIEEGR